LPQETGEQKKKCPYQNIKFLSRVIIAPEYNIMILAD